MPITNHHRSVVTPSTMHSKIKSNNAVQHQTRTDPKRSHAVTKLKKIVSYGIAHLFFAIRSYMLVPTWSSRSLPTHGKRSDWCFFRIPEKVKHESTITCPPHRTSRTGNYLIITTKLEASPHATFCFGDFQ